MYGGKVSYRVSLSEFQLWPFNAEKRETSMQDGFAALHARARLCDFTYRGFVMPFDSKKLARTFFPLPQVESEGSVYCCRAAATATDERACERDLRIVWLCALQLWRKLSRASELWKIFWIARCGAIGFFFFCVGVYMRRNESLCTYRYIRWHSWRGSLLCSQCIKTVIFSVS